MKMLLIILFGLSAHTMAGSEKITLDKNANIFVQDRNGVFQVWNQALLNETKIKIDDESDFSTVSHGSLYRIKKFRSSSQNRDDKRLKNDINDKYKTFYISEKSLPFYTEHNTISSYDRSEYKACYESPRNRWKKKKKKKNGKTKAILGGFGVVIGQVIGGDEGDAISIASGALAVYGLIEIDYANDKYNGKDCLEFFEVGHTQTYMVDGESCSTTRFYSTRWAQDEETHEFFETRCGASPKTYVTYERDPKLWK